MSVTVVVEPGGGSAQALVAPQARSPGRIVKCPVTVVVKETVLAEAGNVEVLEAVVVIIRGGDADAVHLDVEPRLAGYVGKGPVAVVAIKLHGRPAPLMAGPVHAVD